MEQAQAGCIPAPGDLEPGAPTPIEAAVILAREGRSVDKMRGSALRPYDLSRPPTHLYDCYRRSHEHVGHNLASGLAGM